MTQYTELKTIRDYIRYAMSRFIEAGVYFGHGTDNAWDEAISLVLHVLHLPHDLNPALLDANLTKEECEKLATLIDKRVNQRIPVAYLIHEAWFSGLSFYVDERVLIPRSPIAELIENHFEPWISTHAVHNILDLCTGSGCIGIACAYAFPEAQIDASDISKEALAVANINILRHDIEERVHLYHSDLFETLPHKKYDIIVSNPPYVSIDEIATLPDEYLHEPEIGLVAGTHGLDVVKRILQNAIPYLTPEGILVIEVGNSETTLINSFPHIPFTWLDFQRGGGGVFLLTAEQLKTYQAEFATVKSIL